MNFATACFSMNSLMSKRIRTRSDANKYSASDLATSVLPTPVGPRNRNEPTGLFGFFNPARERRIARARAEIAGRCETIRLCSSFSMLRSFCASSSLIDETGTPVQRAITSSTSSFVTSTAKNESSIVCSSYEMSCSSFAAARFQFSTVSFHDGSAGFFVLRIAALHGHRLRRERRSLCPAESGRECSGSTDRPPLQARPSNTGPDGTPRIG